MVITDYLRLVIKPLQIYFIVWMPSSSVVVFRLYKSKHSSVKVSLMYVAEDLRVGILRESCRVETIVCFDVSCLRKLCLVVVHSDVNIEVPIIWYISIRN